MRLNPELEVGTYDTAYLHFFFDQNSKLEVRIPIKVVIEAQIASKDECITKKISFT